MPYKAEKELLRMFPESLARGKYPGDSCCDVQAVAKGFEPSGFCFFDRVFCIPAWLWL